MYNYFLYLGKFVGHALHDLHALTARYCNTVYSILYINQPKLRNKK